MLNPFDNSSILASLPLFQAAQTSPFTYMLMQLARQRATSFADTLRNAFSPFGQQQGYISQRFGNRNEQLYKDVGGWNRGVDYALPENSRIYSPGNLQAVDVRNQGWNTGWGNYVLLRDPQTGETFRMSHLNRGVVQPGQTIKRGQLLGYSGRTGRTTGPHVDVEYTRNNRLADVSQYYPQWFRRQ